MTSSNPPFRQPKKPDPVDAMLDEWGQIRADGPRDQQARTPGNASPVLTQLELMMLLLKRP